MRAMMSVLRLAAIALPLAVAPAAMAQAPAAPATPPATPAPATDTAALKLGSVVQLQSGGPKMTVVALGATATVAWYVESTGAFKKEEFPLAALKIADKDDDEDDEDEDDDDE